MGSGSAAARRARAGRRGAARPLLAPALGPQWAACSARLPAAPPALQSASPGPAAGGAAPGPGPGRAPGRAACDRGKRSPLCTEAGAARRGGRRGSGRKKFPGGLAALARAPAPAGPCAPRQHPLAARVPTARPPARAPWGREAWWWGPSGALKKPSKLSCTSQAWGRRRTRLG